MDHWPGQSDFALVGLGPNPLPGALRPPAPALGVLGPILLETEPEMRNGCPPTNMEVQKGPFEEESGLSTGVCALPC